MPVRLVASVCPKSYTTSAAVLLFSVSRSYPFTDRTMFRYPATEPNTVKHEEQKGWGTKRYCVCGILRQIHAVKIRQRQAAR